MSTRMCKRSAPYRDDNRYLWKSVKSAPLEIIQSLSSGRKAAVGVEER
jgi:hypothetical protein